jgi:hypothetical protein
MKPFCTAIKMSLIYILLCVLCTAWLACIFSFMHPKRIPLTLVDIGDTCSMWFFYALSQKYMDVLFHGASASSFQLTTTPAYSARYPYVSPTELTCLPEPVISTRDEHLPFLCVVYILAALFHHLTSASFKSDHLYSESVLRSAVCLAVAPALLTAGLSEWAVGWINWAACHTVAAYGALCIVISLARRLHAHVAEAKNDWQYEFHAMDRRRSVESVLLISCMIISLSSALNHFCNYESNVSTVPFFEILRDSLTSSPFGFAGLCVACKLCSHVSQLLIACYIRLTVVNFGSAMANWHAAAEVDRLIFFRGLVYHLSGLPVDLAVRPTN